ncbi:hypothetical protein [Lacticaseibacillus camelliae]|uniref:Uncharacterized protein n=1 Tax=Lacticaseibacillus camelliae DSM 22697 = JCM 13995 TaxID=1423730 RepID=A0A0R2ET13_9LACO|nr:hypothetical protein [Lacticaseibacillus camelliae]KRN18299.1 hypothetical protein FC75_GL000779 [Lacticaseibacillus camelliae DSM 22697 = JCM 13995]
MTLHGRIWQTAWNTVHIESGRLMSDFDKNPERVEVEASGAAIDSFLQWTIL